MKNMTEEPSTKKARILIVDDKNAKNIKGYFADCLYFDHNYKRENISITTADDGKSALEKIAQADEEIDLIISDYDMPIMDGFEFYKKVREVHPKYKQKIVFLTGMPDVLEKRLSELEETDCQKPTVIDKSIFYSEIDSIIDRYLG
jgi:CheY-like chemotaxis protein